MKRSNFYSKYLVALLFGALVFQVGCKREAGYHDTNDITTGTDLNTYDYLKSKPGVYDSLLLLIDVLKMKEILTDSAVTLFAPSNSSFQIALTNLNVVRKAQGKPSVFLRAIASGKSVAIADIGKAKADSAHLDTMVARYIIRKLFRSTDFSVGDGQTLYAVRGGYPMHGKRLYADAQGWQNGGSEVIEFANTKRSVFIPNWSITTTSSVNIKTKNGIVHLLEPDHVFGYDEFSRRLTLIPPPENLFKSKPGKFVPMVFKDPNTYDGKVSAGEKYVKLFDGNILTKFLAEFGAANQPLNMVYEFAEPQIANVYTMGSANDSQARDPKSWRIEGSQDGTNYVTLDSRQDQVFDNRFQTRIFDFDNTVAYKFYRLVILSNRGDGLFQMAEWTMNFRTKYN